MASPWMRLQTKEVDESPSIRLVDGIASLLTFSPSDERKVVFAFDVAIVEEIYRTPWRRSPQRALRDALRVGQLAHTIDAKTLCRQEGLTKVEADDGQTPAAPSKTT